MKKKLYEVSRWNTKIWINVENSEKQNVVILVVD